MFSYKSLTSGALILAIIVIADIKPMDLCYRCINIFFYITYFLMRIIKKYIEIQIENNSFIFKWNILIYVPLKYKYSKSICIQVNLTYNAYHCVCLYGKIMPYEYFITTIRIIA